MDTVIVFPIYPGVTHLDFTGPHQVLARLPGAKTIVASIGGEAVSVDGLTFSDLARLEEVERCDVLCVPGGFGCVDAMRSDAYLAQIRRLAASARYVTSVCTGSLILAAAGLLDGRRAACHWAWRDQLALFGAIPDPGRVVRDGSVFTGGGVTAGIDFALTLAAELADETVAKAIQLGLEYAPAPPYDSGRPETAAPEIVELVSARNRARMPDRAAIIEKVAAERRRA
ncbi:DJ-1/PfpI family protein [Inquilinus limosus]|uniref:DJ-1/PfpI family protein n=1 Tax=Inquilinus limosus TaxID=171674 RepID=UPI003F1596EC